MQGEFFEHCPVPVAELVASEMLRAMFAGICVCVKPATRCIENRPAFEAAKKQGVPTSIEAPPNLSCSFDTQKPRL